jgi:DNA-binding PadR family transcriptional regulator
MSTRLVILGLLRERPLYGYEIKHIIQDHMGDWTSIAFGSIYFALNKLAEEGSIAQVATEQEGGRPSRTVYEITAEGHREFMRLLHEVWAGMERQYFALDIGLFFIDALSPEQVRRYLRGRVEQLTRILQHLDAHQGEQSERGMPRQAAVIFAHSRVHLAAELTWTRDLLGQVERGEYP